MFKSIINDKKDNIRDVSIPLNLLTGDSDSGGNERRMVIFLGNNFRDLPRTDFKESMRLTDLCLDYIRRTCPGCDLYYKPHPAETDEASFLNLEGFKIGSSMPAELYYIKHAKDIKYVFSSCSSGNRTAYDMGFNSYIFMNLFEGAIESSTVERYREYFKEMPASFFINSFNAPIQENKKKFSEDLLLEKNIKKILSEKEGEAWLLIGDTSVLANTLSISLLMRKIDPQRKINLIIINHHRWKVVPIEDVKRYFDSIEFVPRIFYSLRPQKILNAIKAARIIKRFPIKAADIIIEVPGLGFPDNCFASYFKDNLRVSVIGRNPFGINCEERVFSRADFKTRPGFILFNSFIEPILGLEKNMFLEGTQRIHNVSRYLRPINDIFNYVWIY